MSGERFAGIDKDGAVVFDCHVKCVVKNAPRFVERVNQHFRKRVVSAVEAAKAEALRDAADAFDDEVEEDDSVDVGEWLRARAGKAGA